MRGVIRFLLIVALLARAASAQQNAGAEPRELLQKLNTLRVDGAQVYRVRELSLRRDAVRIVLDDGKLAFLSAQDGRITGAVFTGQGRIVTMPRDPVEKRSLARALGAPLLDEPFSRAYIRFTDKTADELLEQLRRARAQPFEETTFAVDWNEEVANLNPWHSLRILADLLSTNPQPYFYAALAGDNFGAFDVLVDNRRKEQVLISQMRFVEGVRHQEVWVSFPRENAPAPAAPFAPLSYSIETTIQPSRTLEGVTTVQLKAVGGGERIVPIELSRRLAISAVTDEAGAALPFFQNSEMTPEEMAGRGDEQVFVALPRAPSADETLRLRLAYRGSVISETGNGVLFVGERGSWYPHVGGADHFVPFELNFRWPKRLTMAATGKKLEEREDGEWRTGKWRSEATIPAAGFSLGEYVTGDLETDTSKIDLYANRPASLINSAGERVSEGIRFYEKLLGPFPFATLAVAQVPGSFGEGWPGLIFFSALSALVPAEQSRSQEQFSKSAPTRELARQWWGGVVGRGNYRDQWINEGLANYLALMFEESKQPGELTAQLETYRRELTVKENAGEMVDEFGPLALGYRLRSSKSPRGYEQLVAPKSAWVIHMLRMMLKESAAVPVPRKSGTTRIPEAAKDPDARFIGLLQTLLASYRHRALSTADLQREIEKVMTPEMDLEGSRKNPGRPGAMDWFFDQWVRGTGIPKYSVEFEVQPAGDRFVVRGKLKQVGVPDSLIAPVPLYAPRADDGKPVLLGTVVTNGAETPFQFTVRSAPKKLLIDPNLTLLCRSE